VQVNGFGYLKGYKIASVLHLLADRGNALAYPRVCVVVSVYFCNIGILWLNT